MRPVLSNHALSALAVNLPCWRLEAEAKALVRDFVFRDFLSAFAFMTKVAEAADHADHHPEWSNVYNRVSIRLTTHDSGGITASDVDLAHKIDSLAPVESSHGKP